MNPTGTSSTNSKICKKGRGICKEEGKEEDKTGGEGIIISITWTIINNSKLKEEL